MENGIAPWSNGKTNMQISQTAILRLLIVLAFVALVLEIAANTLFKNTLPAELAQFVKAQDSAPLTGSALAVGLFALIVLVFNYVGLIGLWWGKRWGRIAFSIGALLVPVLVTILGFVDSSSLVSNAVESGARLHRSDARWGNIGLDLVRDAEAIRKDRSSLNRVTLLHFNPLSAVNTPSMLRHALRIITRSS